MIPAVWKFFVKSVIVTSVDESTTRPAFCNPINAINKPIPTDTAFLRLSGIASKIASRTFVNESTIKIIPVSYTHLDVYKRQVSTLSPPIHKIAIIATFITI